MGQQLLAKNEYELLGRKESVYGIAKKMEY
jgi:hypothetical protein